MANDIPTGEPELSITQEVHRLVAEGRECRKSAQESDHEKSPGLS